VIVTTTGGAVIVMLADAVFVVSAALVAVTVKLPGVPPAVYKPALETVPPVADHVTAVFVVPVTVAVNCCDAPVCRVPEVGLIEITTGGAVTVTLAEAVFVVSATLVACTVYVPALVGAVYSPELETVPPVADHVTAVFVVPVTAAVNCCVALVCMDAVVGVIATDTGGGTAVTVTVAEAFLVVSAALVAFTVYVPAVLGAV